MINHSQAFEKAVYELYFHFERWTDLDCELFLKKWKLIAERYFEDFLKNKISFEDRLYMIVNNLFSQVRSKNLLNDMVEYYLEVYEKNWEIYPDVEECLESLKRERLGIISNGSFEQQEKKLDKCDIKKYFETIIVSEKYKVAKPDYRIFKIACNETKSCINENIYIGNNFEHDIIPFIELGGKGVWINRHENKYIIKERYCQVSSLKEINNLKKSNFGVDGVSTIIANR